MRKVFVLVCEGWFTCFTKKRSHFSLWDTFQSCHYSELSKVEEEDFTMVKIRTWVSRHKFHKQG